MNLQKLIEEERALYRASGEKLTVPQYAYEPSGLDYMRPSSLGMCALKHAHEKVGTEPDFPELTAENNSRLAWIMDHGSYVAPMVQEALLYGDQCGRFRFTAEVPFQSDVYHLAGRLDGLLGIGNEQYVLEIKDAEGLVKRSIGEPKLAYCFQLLAYMMVMGIDHGYIVIVSKWGFNCFEIKPVTGGFILLDSWGSRYEPPAWFGENWNTPDVLNFDRVKVEIEKLSNYIDKVEHVGKTITQRMALAPISDPLNDPAGWQCFWKKNKGTKTRNGLAEVSCPFARGCHGVHNKDYPIRMIDGRWEFV